MNFFRLVYVNNGRDNRCDYQKLEDAYDQFVKVTNQGSLMARVDAFDVIDHRFIKTVHLFQHMKSGRWPRPHVQNIKIN
jgi:hypothetical protein